MRRNCFLTPIVALLLTAVSFGCKPSPAVPRIEAIETCFAQPPENLEVEFDMECGYVLVPEFHHREGGRTLRLGVTRLNSGHGTKNSPLFMLAGGPGQTQIGPDFFLLFQPALLGGILEARDIVIIEQRGTAHTEPFLDCPEISSAPWAAYELGFNADDTEGFGADIIRGCMDRLKAQGVDFDAYNSVENAADVNAVRQALGYEQIIYYGASYGSQLGQHVMRDFPEILEAVVLDGANSLSRKSWVEDRALDAQWGIDNLTALCEADEKCRETYEIPALVEAALALFDEGPVPFSYTDPGDASVTVEGEVTVEDMVDLIYEQQGTRIGAMSLPAILTQVTGGGAEQVAEILGAIKASHLIASRSAGTSPMSFLMHAAMVCSDDPVHSKDDVIIEGVGSFAEIFGRNMAEEYVELCSLIGVSELPDSTDVDVKVNVPTLLLTGNLDVATPTYRSRIVADALPHATLVDFPGRTHVQIAAANRCAAEVMTQFVVDPAAPLDTSCTEESPLLGFVLPDGSMSREVN
jgi:pimeloyl-ACP methyl ester carboxylesterase